jgi:hypothetical protein
MSKTINLKQPIDLPHDGKIVKLKPGVQVVSDAIANHWMILPFVVLEGQEATLGEKRPLRGSMVQKSAAEIEADEKAAAEAKKAEEERLAAEARKKLEEELKRLCETAVGWIEQLKAEPGNAGLRAAAVEAVAIAQTFARENAFGVPDFGALPSAAPLSAADQTDLTPADQTAAQELLKPLVDATLAAKAELEKLPPQAGKQKKDAAAKAVADAKAAAEARAKELGVEITWP